ncbi:hypothetical protein H6F90_00120 [Trichocoleus sp. FACHB-591]|uniref:hypothetical protein n=1 Tax=Trichocoleus sp. FACHB-591 TaxID=2692872 RepID=UPI001688CD98|nr:hypothetical protein [Trichocoleus sp. FACHB-591]MBD2093559.1 hypothetical protein [Trichocoleus sp. FACHB-591]
MEAINIPAPKFEQYELVTLYWNKEQHETRVVERYYNLDKEQWLYKVGDSDDLYTSDVLEPRL